MNLGSLQVTEKEGTVRFSVHVKPRASREGVLGVKEGVLEVSVAAPPVDGQANEAVVRVLAAILRVPKRDIRIVTGETGRRKILEIQGLGEMALRARLEAA